MIKVILTHTLLEPTANPQAGYDILHKHLGLHTSARVHPTAGHRILSWGPYSAPATDRVGAARKEMHQQGFGPNHTREVVKGTKEFNIDLHVPGNFTPTQSGPSTGHLF